MFRLMRFLVTGNWHIHRWEIVTVHEVVEKKKDGTESIVAFDYVLRCEGCGNIKAKKV